MTDRIVAFGDLRSAVWCDAMAIQAYSYMVKRSQRGDSLQTAAVENVARILWTMRAFAAGKSSGSSSVLGEPHGQDLRNRTAQLTRQTAAHFAHRDDWALEYESRGLAHAACCVLLATRVAARALAAGVISDGPVHWLESAEDDHAIFLAGGDLHDARDLYPFENAKRAVRAHYEFQLNPIQPEGTAEHPLWDWVCERYPEPQREGTVADAVRRSWLWRLRWENPFERAIAERLEAPPSWWPVRAEKKS